MYCFGKSSSLVYYEKLISVKINIRILLRLIPWSDYAKSLFGSKLHMHGHVVKLTVL